MPDWLMWVWRAWHRLHDERVWRSGGLGPADPGRIPWSKVMAWCRHHGLDPDWAEFLDACIQRMDEEFLAWWRKRQGQ